MKKTIKILLILVIIIILAVLAFIFWPTQPVDDEQNGNGDIVIDNGNRKIDTNDWKTYRNEELGFGFKYPKYVKIILDTNSVLLHKDCSKLNRDAPARMRCDFEGDFSVELYNKTLSDFIEEYKDDFHEGHPFTFIVSQENYVLDNVPCIKLEGTNAMGIGGEDYIFVSKNGKNYLISYNKNVDDYINILSTFKFIK